MPKYFVSDKNKPTVEKILTDYCYKPKWEGNNLVISESLNDRITDILGNLLEDIFELRVEYINKGKPLTFISTFGTIKECFNKVEDILCDEIYIVYIKKNDQ